MMLSWLKIIIIFLQEIFGQKVKMRNSIPYNINFVSDLETRYFNEPMQIKKKKAAWIFE